MKRILSLGGGGIKGAMTAAYLAHMEEASGKPIADCFDLIAGTSTGGILAIGLALSVKASDLVKFYQEQGPKIFPVDRNYSAMNTLMHLCRIKYSSFALVDALKTQFAERTLGAATTRLVIPSVQPDKAQMYLFKTRHHPLFKRDHLISALDVALATSAAPSYLPPHTIQGVGTFADGGLWANNPVGLAVTEAVSYLNWEPEELHVLSIECPQESQTIPAGSALSWLIGPKVMNRIGALQTSAAKGTALALMRDVGNLPHPARYFEALQCAFPAGYFSLDGVKQIDALIGVGSDEARKQSNMIVNTFMSSSKIEFMPNR